MADVQPPAPAQILAVLLGASFYKYAPNLARGRAFYNSSQDFSQYLTDTVGLPEKNVASFFDESRSAGDQLRDIRDFLERRIREMKNTGTPAHDLIVHYVGHGLFSGGDNDYCLAVRATDEQDEGFTSIRMRDLASVIRNSAAFLRKYLIFDCCFSGTAYTQFQSGPLSVVQVKVHDLLDDESPQRGTSLLCSASAKDPSLAPKGLARTMFSDCLLTVLTEGHEGFGPRLSFSEIGELVRIQIKETYGDSGVRPEVHSPDQRSGDVARMRLFPNPAWEKVAAEEDARERRENEKRKTAEAEAQERLRQERLENERQEQQRLERERLEKERLERERLERERLEHRLEQERLEKERLERERLERERLEHRLEQERLEKERLERERREKERLEHRLEQERLEKERLEHRLEQERLEKERLERERREKERLERERLEQERLEQQRLDQERLEQHSREQERLEQERSYRDWLKRVQTKELESGRTVRRALVSAGYIAILSVGAWIAEILSASIESIAQVRIVYTIVGAGLYCLLIIPLLYFLKSCNLTLRVFFIASIVFWLIGWGAGSHLDMGDSVSGFGAAVFGMLLVLLVRRVFKRS